MRAWAFAIVLTVAGCGDGSPFLGPVGVSDLGCAGLEDPDGNVLVPTVSEDGCTGATVSGHYDCDGCSLDAGDPVTLFVAYGDLHIQECMTVPLDEEGDFSFGPVAPALGYMTDYSWSAGSSGLVVFGVCSDPVFVSDEVEPDPCDGCTTW